MNKRVLPTIDDVLQEFQSHLREYGLLEPDNTANVQVWMKGSTPEGADTLDMTGSSERAAYFSQRLGLPVEILDSFAEADYFYQSVLRSQPISPHQPVVALDIGEARTLLAFGKGHEPERRPSHPERLLASLDIGWGKMLLEQSIDPLEIQLALLDVMAQLEDTSEDAWRSAMKDRMVFLGMTPVYQLLSQIQQASLNGEQNNEALNVAPNGLHRVFVDACLEKEGLARLHEALEIRNSPGEPLSETSLENEDEAEPISPSELIGTLIILKGLTELLDIEQFYVGAGGGLNGGLLVEMAHRQIMARNNTFGEVLHGRYEQTHPQTRRALEKLFPEFCHCLEGRVKDRVSITHKLNESALSADAQALPLHTLEEAARRVKDGHGFTLVLSDVSPTVLSHVCDSIIRAIGSGNLDVLAIKNYHGGEPDTPPYFNEEDVERIRATMDHCRLQPSMALESLPTVVIAGADALKPSGYTSTQLRIRLRNPDTEAFDLPEVDLHICGEKVSLFYRGADHLVYEIRAGKDIYQGNPGLRDLFEPEVQPLLDALGTMPEDLFRRFTDYRGQIYAYLRRLEMETLGLPPLSPPEPPADLPLICHWESLTRLSDQRRQFLADL